MNRQFKQKGLNSIQTMSGRANGAKAPYRSHFAMGVLAMEKSRRESERANAQSRIDAINERLVEIDASMSDLREESIEREKAANEQGFDQAQRSPRRSKTSDFRLKY